MSWFRRKPSVPAPAPAPRAPVPQQEDPGARSRGKPLLFLLEDYVLDTIGALDPEKGRNMPSLIRPVFGGGDDWRATLRTVLDLGDTVDDSIRRQWERNQKIARENNVTLTPQDFARLVVDQNFSRLLDDA
jgi:hypothetical protein